jgi:hypothetical protein
MIADEKQRETSITEPKPNPNGQHDNRKSEKDGSSEAKFLDREAENAKAAIWSGLRKFKEDFGDAADVRMWTKEHPWIAVSVAAAAGFAAANAIRVDFHESKEKNKPSASEATGAGDFAELFRSLQSVKENCENTHKITRKSGAISKALTWLGALIVEFLQLSAEKAVSQAIHPSGPPSTASNQHDISGGENGKTSSRNAPQGPELENRF